MKVENDTNKRSMIYTAAGVGTGAIAGGTFGYLQRPWIKNGELTDTFIKQVNKSMTAKELEKTDSIISDLKKVAETGNIDYISEHVKFALEEVKNKPVEEIKTKANKILAQLLEVHQADNLEELPQKIKESIRESSLEGTQKKIDELKALKITEDITAEEIAKLYEKNVYSWTEKSIEKIQEAITNKGKKAVIEELKQDIDLSIKAQQAGINNIKDEIKKHIDISGKKMKDLPSNAEVDEKDLYNIIKKTISETNWKNAGKWAGIGATVLGVVGLGTSYLTNKKNG